MGASIIVVDELIELQLAFPDSLRCIEVVKAFDVEIGGMALRMDGVGHAADRCVHLEAAIAARDLDQAIEQGPNEFHLLRQGAQIGHVLGGGGSTPIDSALLRIVLVDERAIAAAARQNPAAHPEVLATASDKRLGLERLRAELFLAAW